LAVRGTWSAYVWQTRLAVLGRLLEPGFQLLVRIDERLMRVAERLVRPTRRYRPRTES
jgi:hypothetical protein